MTNLTCSGRIYLANATISAVPESYSIGNISKVCPKAAAKKFDSSVVAALGYTQLQRIQFPRQQKRIYRDRIKEGRARGLKKLYEYKTFPGLLARIACYEITLHRVYSHNICSLFPPV